MSNIKLYYLNGGPASRAVCLTIKALNLSVEFIEVDAHAGGSKTEEYLRMNPQGTIPTLDDNGKYIYDSHAINIYLATVYGNDDTLCPKDPYLRAVLDQRMHFQDSVLNAKFGGVVRPVHQGKATAFAEEDLKSLYSAYDILDTFLTKSLYAVGDDVTVADFNMVADVTTAMMFIPSLVDTDRYPNIFAWLERMKTLPYFDEANTKPLENLFDMLKDKFDLKK